MANFYADEQFPYITSNRLIELGQNQDHAGIIVCTDDSDKIRLADRIHQTISKNTESSEGQLIRVVKPSN